MPDQPTAPELLTQFLLSDTARSHAAAKHMASQNLWDNAVRLAFAWRCVPRLRSRLAADDSGIDQEARASLARMSAVGAAQSAMVCHQAGKALLALEEAGIRAAVFKGLGMIASVYRNPADRMLSDADILLEKHDVSRAMRVLADVGFQPAISMDIDAWLKLLDERVYRVHDFVDFEDATGAKLDVHWRVRTPVEGEFAIGRILDRSVEGIVGRTSVHVVAPEDSILLTSHHMVRDRLAPRSAVKDLSDISAWLELPDVFSPTTLTQRARAAGLSTSLLAALTILSGIDDSGRAPEMRVHVAATCTPAERIAAMRLASFFRLQLQRGVVSEAVVGLTDITPSLAGRFIVSRFRSLTSRSYKRHKFAGSDQERNRPDVRIFFRDLLTMTPRRFVAYRALARETRAYAEGSSAG
jgi:hypothetical protein